MGLLQSSSPGLSLVRLSVLQLVLQSEVLLAQSLGLKLVLLSAQKPKSLFKPATLEALALM